MVRSERVKSIVAIAAVSLGLGAVLFVGDARHEGARGARAEHEREREGSGAGRRKKPVRLAERFQKEFEAASAGEAREGEGIGERDLFSQWFFEQRSYPADSIPGGALSVAFLKTRHDNDDSNDPDDAEEGHWRALGPSTIPDGQTDASLGILSPVSGRVTAIAAHPRNPNVVYVGGAQGGVWKTTNARSANPHWRPLTDHEASLAVGSIAIDPVDPNIVYVGTGEPNRSCDSYYGQGILRSTDGGENWKLLGGGGGVFGNPGPFVGRSVARIIVDPATAGSRKHTTLWASTTIGVFSGGTIPTCGVANPAAPFGLWRSLDSGETWELQQVPVPNAGAFSVQDMVLDPANHDTLYVAVRSDAVWKSTNAATGAPATFTKMAAGFTTSPNRRRINLSIGGPSASNMLYAAVENGTNSSLLGFFKSTDGAASWTQITTIPNYCGGQCFYDMTVAVDPSDVAGNRVFIGGNPHTFAADLSGVPGAHSNWRTDDGGAHWTAISQGDGVTDSLHTDDHAYAFGPDGSVYDGNDGGIWRSSDLGASWTSMNTDLAITQFQGVSTHPDKDSVLGGTQDNGTNIRNRDLLHPPKWFHSDFGDGGQSLIDQSSPQTMYHTYFNESFNFMGPARTDIGGTAGPGSWPFVGTYYGYGAQYYNGMNPKDPVSFYAPLAQNVAYSPNVVYFGSDRVYRSPNPLSPLAKIPSWTAVSPRLTKTVGNYVSWIAAFPKLVNGKEVLYTGSSDGAVFSSSAVDGGGVAAWTRIDGGLLPNRAVSGIALDTRDKTGNTAIVGLSGFEASTPATLGHVFITKNGLSGAPTWTNISGNLPDLPINGIVIDYVGRNKRAVLYAASDIGVFRSRDQGTTWKLVSKGLPFVSVFSIERNATTGQIVASTHGRGMFELNKDE